MGPLRPICPLIHLPPGRDGLCPLSSSTGAFRITERAMFARLRVDEPQPYIRMDGVAVFYLIESLVGKLMTDHGVDETAKALHATIDGLREIIKKEQEKKQ